MREKPFSTFSVGESRATVFSTGSRAGIAASNSFSTIGNCTGGGGGGGKLTTGGRSVGDANIEFSADSGIELSAGSMFTSNSCVFFDARLVECFSASSLLDAGGSCSIGSGKGGLLIDCCSGSAGDCLPSSDDALIVGLGGGDSFGRGGDGVATVEKELDRLTFDSILILSGRVVVAAAGEAVVVTTGVGLSTAGVGGLLLGVVAPMEGMTGTFCTTAGLEGVGTET